MQPVCKGRRWAVASGLATSTFSEPVVDSVSFSESESLPYETREAMAADIFDVVNSTEREGRDFRCDARKKERKMAIKKD